MDKTHHRCKISQKYPQNMDKIPCRNKTSLFYPDFMDKTNHRCKTSRKYPQNMEEIPCRNKISSFQPQNRDKPPPQKGNVLGNATKPGETSAPKKKCPGNTPKTGRKCIFTQKKVTGMSPLLLLTDLGIVRWGLAVFFQRIQLGAQKGICRMLHQRV